MQHIKFTKYTILLAFVFLLFHPIQAQEANPFKVPEIEKVTHAQRQAFESRFEDIKWTGQGLYGSTAIDDISTIELRARLQKAFGDPTQTLEDLIDSDKFRPAKAIQFEYWFIVDDKYPLMVLDVDGPFSTGLVYGGASRYIDLMPQIKRAFSKKLMEIQNMGEFQDYFYSPEREQWFNVTYKDGKFSREKIDSPEGMTIEYDY